MREDLLKDIDKEIRDILLDYMALKTYTYTPGEREAEGFLMDYFSGIPYFRENPGHYGTYPIKGDPFGRRVCYGMVRGRGNKAIVLIHHYDVVGVEDFKLLKDYAHDPEALEKKLLEVVDSLPPEAGADLESGEWLFGKGGCDMKGGGAIQMALLRRYSEIEDFPGTVIVLAVPDEENMSAGMRGAVSLLAELKEKYDLDYRLMINSEPHQRKDPEVGMFSEGSVGKVLPFVYVRGYMSHAGKVFEGFNPVNLMSRIVEKTELNMDFSDVVGDESAPPPTWLWLKDSKSVYDVSMPLSMYGCFSVLMLDQSPVDVLDRLRNICVDSFDAVLEEMKASYERFREVAKPVVKELPWTKKVMSIGELCAEAENCHGAEFRKAYEAELAELTEGINSGELNILESNELLVDKVFEYIDDLSPRVVYGLVPPYYPNVSNCFFREMGERKDISSYLSGFAQKHFGQSYDREFFFTGLCDLSFSGLPGGMSGTKEEVQMLRSRKEEVQILRNRKEEVQMLRNQKEEVQMLRNQLEEYMPLFGDYYDVPFEDLEKIGMPCINIGPWGKDFHKLTERVLKEDLYVRTPAILNEAIRTYLSAN